LFENSRIVISCRVETIGNGFQKLMSDKMNGAVLEVSTFKTEYVLDPLKAV
jgi:hypothetical protein